MVENYIQIIEGTSGYMPISINKGELIYFTDVAKAHSYFEALLGEGDDNNLVIKVDNKIIKQLNQNEALFNKRKIAYVSDELALLTSESIQTNVDLYLKSIDHKGSPVVKTLFSEFNISTSKIIQNLTDLEVYVVRLAIGLAKDPELLILNNPYAQIAPENYHKLMSFLYDMLLERDLTCLCCLSAKYLSDKYPGRIIE